VILRRAHLDALERAAHETFIDRLAEHFARPAWRIEQAVGCAYTAGHTTEAAIAGFVARWLAAQETA
jgi:hypothetical protein